jgi:hypothetical protein
MGAELNAAGTTTVVVAWLARTVRGDGVAGCGGL